MDKQYQVGTNYFIENVAPRVSPFEASKLGDEESTDQYVEKVTLKMTRAQIGEYIRTYPHAPSLRSVAWY